MAGTLINTYENVGNDDIDNIELVLDKTRRGLCAVSLTEWMTTTVPAIAANSVIEVNGAMYEFGTEEALGGSPSNGTVYIKLIPAGASITAQMTNTAPVWDEEKQGWYSPTGGEENYRYLPFVMFKVDTAYSDKKEISKQDIKLLQKIIEIGDWNMDSTSLISVTHGLPDFEKIRTVQVLIRNDNGNLVYLLDSIDQATGLTAGAIQIIAPDYIFLERTDAGHFNDINFDATSYNRGWVTVWYEV